jgi:ribosomal protein L24
MSRFTPPAHQLPTPREIDKQRSLRTESGKTPVIKKSKTVHLSPVRLVAATKFSENPNFD